MISELSDGCWGVLGGLLGCVPVCTAIAPWKAGDGGPEGGAVRARRAEQQCCPQAYMRSKFG